MRRHLLATAVVAAGASVALTTLGDVGRPAPADAAATTALSTTIEAAVDEPSVPRAPTGGLAVRLPDPMTGEPIAAFCVELVDDEVVRTDCTDTGTLLLSDVPEGDYLVLAYRAGRSEVAGAARQVVVAGEVAEVVAGE